MKTAFIVVAAELRSSFIWPAPARLGSEFYSGQSWLRALQ